MKQFLVAIIVIAVVAAGAWFFLIDHDQNEFIGDWQVAIQCLQHEREPGSGEALASPVHLTGTFSIVKRDDMFLLQPESGEFKDEFADCELRYNPGKIKMVDGSNFSCDSLDPGPDASNLSGTCDLMHANEGPTPHSVQIFLLGNSAIWDGGTNPVIRFSHPGRPGHAGWVH